MPLSLALTIVVVVAAVVAALMALDRQRTRAWRSLVASREGWQFLEREAGLGRFGRFRACRSGEQHQIQRRAFGPADGARVDLAEISHVERDRVLRRRPRATVQTACLVEDPALRLPAFFARPRSPLDELGRLANLPDLPFPDDPAFASVMLVQTDEADAVRKLLDVRSRAWLSPRAAGHWTYEGVGDALLIVAPRPLAGPELRELIAAALELTRLWREASPATPATSQETP